MRDLDVHLAAIAAGDADAFGRWLAGAESRVRASLTSFATAVDVEVVLQETLVRVWQVAPRFVPDGRPDGLVRLAVRIGRNLAISEVRRIRARPVAADELDTLADDTPAVAEPDPLLRRTIAECRDKLPPKPRQVLDARLVAAGGREDAELADERGMRINTFLQNFTRARKLLAECLGKAGIVIEGMS